ncbi:MAG: PKD domain-containing protein [Thermoleophilaceae bacterium]|nr:PKD domain-containing protein [Thermoleophilaceae bacterium]
MSRPSRIAKRLLLPALLAVTFLFVQVVLAAPPQPSFTVTGPAGNECGVYTFTSTSTDPDNDIESIDWTLGGATATGSPTQATFGTPGARLITMTATDGSAGDPDAGPETVPAIPQTVSVVNAGVPTAAIGTAPANPVQPGATVTVSAAGSTDQGNGSIAKYEFDLNGDNTFETNNGTSTATTSFAAGDPASHTVRVRVTDNCGATDTAVTSVLVQNTPPTASFTFAPSPAAIGRSVTFDASGSSADTTKYEWSFDGDATFEVDGGATATTTHTFTTSGSYLVYLRVTDAEGATNITNRLVRVNAKPIASFSYAPIAPLIGEQVTFNGTTSSDPDGSITKYEWDLDGNGSYETLGATPTHTYTSAATVNVKLRVTDGDNTVSNVLERSVTIQVTRPVAGFSYAPHDPLPGQAVTLTSTSTPSASPGAPSLVATHWDFAYSPLVDFTLDGAGGSIVTSFATAGAHTVAVKVTESGGGFAIATDTIVVNAPPQASFTVAPAKPVEGREVTFASTSNDPDGPLVKQEWDLDNNDKYERLGAVTSTTKLKKGTRTVRLRVTDSKGATATTAVPVKVAAKPYKPPPDVTKTLGYARRKWGLLVVALIVRVPSKTTVRVQCKGRGCPRGKFVKRSRKKAAALRFTKFKGSLRQGATITVISSRSDSIAEYFTYKVRGNERSPLKIKRCKTPGAKKLRACPS